MNFTGKDYHINLVCIFIHYIYRMSQKGLTLSKCYLSNQEGGLDEYLMTKESLESQVLAHFGILKIGPHFPML